MFWAHLTLAVLFIGAFSPVSQAQFEDDHFERDIYDSRYFDYDGYHDVVNTNDYEEPESSFDDFETSNSKSYEPRTVRGAGPPQFNNVGDIGNILRKFIRDVMTNIRMLIDKFSRKLKKFESSSGTPMNEVFGVSQLFFDGRDIKCSGIHLKPWIVLTLADCVKGLDAGSLYVKVKVRDGSPNYKVVGTNSIVIDPKFKPGKDQFNFALLSTYALSDWDVDEFQLPSDNSTAKYVSDKKTHTFINRWGRFGEPSFLIETPATVTANFNVCEYVGDSTNWFCVVEDGVPQFYENRDSGIPFYGYSGNGKELFGAYTEKFINKRVTGHLFQSIIPSIPWIKEFMKKYPVPPSK